jgi:hypothetical protein
MFVGWITDADSAREAMPSSLFVGRKTRQNGTRLG